MSLIVISGQKMVDPSKKRQTSNHNLPRIKSCGKNYKFVGGTQKKKKNKVKITRVKFRSV